MNVSRIVGRGEHTMREIVVSCRRIEDTKTRRKEEEGYSRR